MDPVLAKYLQKLEKCGEIQTRSMFGGYGLYHSGVMFALFAFDTLYFKTDKNSVEFFQKKKCKPFIYLGKPGAPVVMSYYTIPKSAWSKTESLQEWFALAIQAALRAKTKSNPKSKKQKPFPKSRSKK